MILDKLCEFDPPGTSLAIAVGTQASTNVLDLLHARDLGVSGETMPMKVLANVGTTTFTSGGAATVSVAFQGSVDNSAWTTYATSPTQALANLTAGSNVATFDLPIRAGGAAMPRYYRLLWTVAGATVTAGTVYGYISFSRQENHTYPKNYPTPI